MSDNALQLISATLIEATAAIEPIYFQVPFAGLQDPKFRERVYCYELYHQMRLRWPRIPHKITGEIDKRGHPWIYHNELDSSKPDFTIHIPGLMANNLLVIEVKGPDPSDENVKKDLQKLTGYRLTAGYSAAYYLIYGITVDKMREFAARCSVLAGDDGEIDLTRVSLFGHSHALSPASQVPWLNAP